MSTHNFTCYHCKETYEIDSYSMGFAGAIELRCNSCSTTLWVGLYDPVMEKFTKKYKDKYGIYRVEYDMQGIEDALLPCECSGSFISNAPYRCKSCNKEVDLQKIINQIGGRGPGVAMGKIIYGDRDDAKIWNQTIENA